MTDSVDSFKRSFLKSLWWVVMLLRFQNHCNEWSYYWDLSAEEEADKLIWLCGFPSGDRNFCIGAVLNFLSKLSRFIFRVSIKYFTSSSLLKIKLSMLELGIRYYWLGWAWLSVLTPVFSHNQILGFDFWHW